MSSNILVTCFFPSNEEVEKEVWQSDKGKLGRYVRLLENYKSMRVEATVAT